MKMKKFNPENEIKKINDNANKNNASKLSNLFVPILVVSCSCMAMTAVAFSAYLEEDTVESYNVHIDVINGDIEDYDKVVREGMFHDTITSKNTFGSIECSSGNLSYDSLTQTVSSPYINRNTSCVLTFMNEGKKNLNVAGLGKVNDNNGTSYYYKADNENNYVLLKDMMFRIVRTNGDGSIRLVLNDEIMPNTFGDSNNYMNSSIKTSLDEWFNLNFTGASYVVQGDFDVTNYDTIDIETLVNLEGYYNSYVGLLSVREVELISQDVEDNYLKGFYGTYLMNGNGIDNVYAFKDNKVVSLNRSEVLSVRPVVNINAKLVGSGTKNNPYTVVE